MTARQKTSRPPNAPDESQRVPLHLTNAVDGVRDLEAVESLTVDQREAARLTTLSAKTLGRLADAGEPIGRIKAGRRVLYLRASLERWLIMKAADPAHPSSI